jgi:peptide/nickel transport system permease protein
MIGYLARRFFQMILVVLLSTMAIYALLNIAPGGPLSGLQAASANRRQRVSEADIARLEAYLGLDKPLILRYVVWLIGDDWLGADWMSLSLKGYQVDEGEKAENVRFWSEPGVAYINPGYELWVRGEQDGESILANHVIATPTGDRPEDMSEVRVIEMRGPDMEVERAGGEKVIIRTTAETEWTIPRATSRPEDGAWLNLGWLFNPYRGLLGHWAGYHADRRGVLRLDWGTSWKIATGQPVTMLIMSRLGNTLSLMSLSIVVSLVIAIPIGILSAVKQYSRLDYAVTTFGFFGSSMPVFWFGLMMILVFSYKFREWGLPFMPAGGVVMSRRAPAGQVLDYLNAAPGGLVDRLVHIVMPGIVLSLFYMANWSRFTRSSMLEVLRQDYVRTARAKGLRERIVLSKHALRNAVIPLITVIALQIPGIFGGATITETVFSYHGIGRLYFEALSQDDWPVVMIILLITSLLVVVSILLSDILYTVVDPRIRLE